MWHRPAPAVVADAPKPLWRRRAASAREGRCGFTLIELLIVLAVILILASIMVMTWPAVRERIVRMHCQTNLSKAQKIFMEYGANNYGYLPPISASGDSSGSQISYPNPDRHYVVEELKEYGAGADIFTCPASPYYEDTESLCWRSWVEGGLENSIKTGRNAYTDGYVLYVGFWPWGRDNWQWHPWLLPSARRKADRVDSPGNPPIMSDEMKYEGRPGGDYNWQGFYHWRDRDDYPNTPGGGGHTVFLSGAVVWYTWEELWAKSQEEPAPVPFMFGTQSDRHFYAGWAPREE